MLTHPAPRPTSAGHPLGTAAMITISAAGDQVCVALAGEVDATNADRLRTTLFTHIGEGRTRVVLDVGALTFIDCAGLTAIRKAAACAEALGGSLRLHGEARPAVRRMLQLTRMAASFSGR
ncbi:STAS domain-containing protein [Actinoallomurus rhizosphaericola]|uniref:STAS domain-containing protein n=1 Tax=Actinoallomurus rhizosphaericola TaxID=2952536 RepID=UPI0020907A25|nr:STAS domain-containing protein [Actinoallomurus rhizosphaericola]MCO5994627.1 STAS domain-containing protein [Actinoallomurus rhizosphaericola]